MEELRIPVLSNIVLYLVDTRSISIIYCFDLKADPKPIYSRNSGSAISSRYQLLLSVIITTRNYSLQTGI